jgi:hypothetical protein
MSINDSGQIVGAAWNVNPFPVVKTMAVLFDPTGGENNIFLSSPAEHYSFAYSINNRAQIIGWGGLCSNNPCGTGPVIFDPAGQGNNVNLYDLIDPCCGWFLKEVWSINDSGWIVGEGINPAGKHHAFLMKPIPPKTIYVDGDVAGANDGSSWLDAFNYLQDALAAAWSGDEIRVAKGIYTPDSNSADPNGSGDREATFQLINGVTIKGGYAGFGHPDPNARDIQLYETILTGDLNGDDVEVAEPCDLSNEPSRAENSYHVVTAVDTEEKTVLDGFTITGGHANGEGWPLCLNCGGGMYSYSGSPTLMNCTITRNTAGVGGGVSYRGQRHFLDDSVITNNIITENTAVDGGGIYCSGSPTITDNIITKNIAVNGGGIYCYEGGMIANNTIEKNTAQCGGGIFTWEDYAPIIINNIISENWAQEEGGGIGTHDNSPTIIGNLIIGNATAGNGGGIYLQSALSEEITNNTIAGNKAARGGGICTYIVSMKVTNCILWGNTADIGSQIAMKTIDPSHRFSILTVNYSDMLGGALEIYVGGAGFLNWGEGNIDADPLFVQPGYWNAKDTWIEGDYHLLPGSPCIDAGDPNYLAVPYETDLDGKPRVIGGRVDMGAYEAPIFAEARILPRTINLASKGNWITCYIWLPEQYNVANIEPNSIFLDDEIQPVQFSVDEQAQLVITKFSREDVQTILEVGEIDLTITCQLADGTVFEGTDTIKVIDKAGSKSAKQQ